MTNEPSPPDDRSLLTRLWHRLRSIEPLALAMLGLLGFVGTAIESLEFLELFYLFWLFALWPFAKMLYHSVLQSLGLREGASEDDPRSWLAMDSGLSGTLAFLGGIALTLLNPLVIVQDAMQLLGSVLAIGRYRGPLPRPADHDQSVSYRLPLEGEWTVVNGSPIKEHSHSWYPATQRYAYDFVQTDAEGRSRPEGADSGIEHYYCYDEPVIAPASGTVVDVGDGDPEFPRGGGLSHPLKRSIVGNFVTIRHDEDEYSTLVHLKPGSIAVEPGQTVERGEEIGRCGHSGNSSEPHLHFQVQDHPAFELSAGLPVSFEVVSVETPGPDPREQTDWSEPEGPGTYLHVGQRVTADDAPTFEPPAETAAPSIAHRVVRAGSRLWKGVGAAGFVSVLGGFAGIALGTVVAIILGLASLGGLWTGTKRLLRGTDIRLASVSVIGGALVGGGALAAIEAFELIPWLMEPYWLGLLLLGIAFVLYSLTWEAGRRWVFDRWKPERESPMQASTGQPSD